MIMYFSVGFFFVNFYVFVISLNVITITQGTVWKFLSNNWDVMFALIGENPQLFTKFLYIIHLPLSSNHDIRTGWDVSSHWDSHFLFHISPDKCSNSFFFPVKLSIKIWLYEGCIYWSLVNVVVGNRLWWTVHYRGRGTRNLRKRWWWVVQGDKLLLSQ